MIVSHWNTKTYTDLAHTHTLTYTPTQTIWPQHSIKCHIHNLASVDFEFFNLPKVPVVILTLHWFTVLTPNPCVLPINCKDLFVFLFVTGRLQLAAAATGHVVLTYVFFSFCSNSQHILHNYIFLYNDVQWFTAALTRNASNCCGNFVFCTFNYGKRPVGQTLQGLMGDILLLLSGDICMKKKTFSQYPLLLLQPRLLTEADQCWGCLSISTKVYRNYDDFCHQPWTFLQFFYTNSELAKMISW